jgi:hypothetical protein
MSFINNESLKAPALIALKAQKYPDLKLLAFKD